ncbi:MAG: cation transporter [Bdellovibrio sp.]|nr:cation transporter [Bdellovibrio sp.]
MKHNTHVTAKSHHGSINVLIKALIITLIFMFIEFFGGLYTKSLALISDAAHMLTDVGALSVSIIAAWIAQRPSTPKMSFGYHRVEILAALGNGLLIWFLAGMLIYEAILRIGNLPEIKGFAVFVIALVGLGANLLSMWILKDAQKKNFNVKAAYLHVFTDSLGSIGAIVAGAVIWLSGWRPIDLIISIIFSLLMLFSSWKLVKESFHVLMESTPSGVDPEEVKKDLSELKGVQEVHDLHIWTVASGRHALSVHLISENQKELLHKASSLLEKNFGILHTTIQIEHPSEFESKKCYDCTSH